MPAGGNCSGVKGQEVVMLTIDGRRGGAVIFKSGGQERPP